MPEATSVSAQEAPDKKELAHCLQQLAGEIDASKQLASSPSLPPSVEAPQQAPDMGNKLQDMFSSPQGLQELLTNPEAAARKLLGPEMIAQLEAEKAEQQRQGLENKAALIEMAQAIDKRFNELFDFERSVIGHIAGLQNLIIGEKKLIELIERIEKRAEKAEKKGK